MIKRDTMFIKALIVVKSHWITEIKNIVKYRPTGNPLRLTSTKYLFCYILLYFCIKIILNLLVTKNGPLIIYAKLLNFLLFS